MTRIGYADPPYIGCAHLYLDQPSYDGEVDHVALIEREAAYYDKAADAIERGDYRKDVK